MPVIPIGWHDPKDMAAMLAARQTSYALLYSGMKTGYSGRYSFLAWGEERRIEGTTLDDLQEVTSDSTLCLLPHWYGVVGYEAAHGAIGDIPPTSPCSLALPAVRFCRFESVLRYDHTTSEVLYEGKRAAPVLSSPLATQALPSVAFLHEMLPYEPYCEKVQAALSAIYAGAFYQVNLTRKYQGRFERIPTSVETFALFARLSAASPAPYSALLSFGGDYLLSSSPELFIAVDEAGHLTTRPIKGTAALETAAENLRKSQKEQAENLMIVDLMRNDLSRCCVAGTVQVPALFEVDAFSTLRHLSSTITGQLRDSATVSDVLRATFPPGSMTGAPKRAAIHWIAAEERMDRGWYSGALGWIKGRSCEFSVVIRSIVGQQERFEFQVGGGIVADSDPANEYRETLIKARGICTALGITLS